ncbi:MAG: nucleotidyltransferase domain-containing protein [bacterium]
MSEKELSQFGLSERTTKILLEFFNKFPQVELVKIYGSRAKGNYKKESDIDFAIFGKDIDFRLQSKIAGEIEELPTPYKFDITHYESLKHLPLKEHIDRVGKIFYTKKTL